MLQNFYNSINLTFEVENTVTNKQGAESPKCT